MIRPGTPPLGEHSPPLPAALRRWFAVLVLAALALPAVGESVRAEQAAETSAYPAALTPDSEPTEGESGDPVGQRLRLLDRLGLSAWHKSGHRGRGLKVAVLDSGFQGYQNHLGHALPEHVTIKSFRTDGNLEARDSQHGILCGEVIHALAPDAELLLANWEPDRPDSFLEAVRWARQEGARVITCSVVMPTWSDGDGHGAVHDELARILGPGDGAGDALLFASAGNTAQRHWAGAFQDNGDREHEWKPGRTGNLLRVWGSEPVSVELCWAPGPTYEVVVQDLTADRPAARCRTALGSDRCSAVVRFLPEAGHTYSVRVRLVAGTPGRFHLVALGGTLQHFTPQGSIPFPGDGPEVLAVGAVGPDGKRCGYSSCGVPGSAKPDFVAQVPFPSLWRVKPFAGTSAAAPQAAALTAVLWARHPAWDARHVRDALRNSVHRLGPAAHDWETGFGRIELP